MMSWREIEEHRVFVVILDLYEKIYKVYRRRWWMLAVVFGLIELNVVPVFKRGFFCNDPTISYKFRGDTISMATLMIVSIPVPLALLWILELAACESTQGKSSVWKVSLLRALRVYRDYVYGQVMCLAVVSIAKTSFGGLRPHFLDTCKADVQDTCTTGEFVTEYTCTNQMMSNFFMLDSRKSFPSGHSSLSVFLAVFFAWYLQMRFSRNTTKTHVLLMQLMALAWGTYCPISRVTDYRHHWWDALAGSVLGVIFAVLTCRMMARNFQYLQRPKSPALNGNGILAYDSNNRLLQRTENHSSRSDV